MGSENYRKINNDIVYYLYNACEKIYLYTVVVYFQLPLAFYQEKLLTTRLLVIFAVAVGLLEAAGYMVNMVQIQHSAQTSSVERTNNMLENSNKSIIIFIGGLNLCTCTFMEK